MAETVLLKVPVGDGTDDFVEVQVNRSELGGSGESGVVRAADDSGRLEAVGYTLADAIDRVMPALRTVLSRLREGALSPDEITIELGLQVGGETGMIFAKGTVEANIAVSMTWRRKAVA